MICALHVEILVFDLCLVAEKMFSVLLTMYDRKNSGGFLLHKHILCSSFKLRQCLVSSG